MANNYVTPIEVAKLLGYDISDVSLMQEVAVMLEVVEEFVDDFIGTTLVPENASSKIYDGLGLSFISLGYYLRTLTSVEVIDQDGVVITALSPIYVGPNPTRFGAYRYIERGFDPDTGVQATFPVGFKNIKVTGNWGLLEIPPAVKMAIAWTVKDWFDKRSLSTNIKFETGYGRYVHYIDPDKVTAIPPHAQIVLSKYINNRILAI